MGWFWADSTPSAATAAATAPHPLPRSDAIPPPGCPMHKPSSSLKARLPEAASTPAGACPYVPPDVPTPASEPSKSSVFSKLNPLNNMPMHLSQKRAEGQTVALPVERETSTIPKGDGGLWEYPSPQQMYNAMLRKGYTDTPQDAVESMVAVHNFLNEGAWAEIVEWERRFSRGLAHGWAQCRRGEEGSLASAMLGPHWGDKEIEEPKLVRFTGRPGELTPKAQMLQLLSRAYPKKFEPEPPFDRHDWYVKRCNKEGICKEVRYVIDYYSGPPEPTGEPVFYLDVRPAVDTPSAAVERLMRWGGDVWWRASGGSVRENK